MVQAVRDMLSAANLVVFELRGYDSLKNALLPKVSRQPIELASSFLEWAFNKTDVAVAIQRDGNVLVAPGQIKWMLVAFLSPELKSAMRSIARLMAKGLSVDIGLGLSAQDIVSWFTSVDYELAAKRDLSSHTDAALLSDSVAADKLGLLNQFGCESIVISNHDMDPIYVLQLPHAPNDL